MYHNFNDSNSWTNSEYVQQLFNDFYRQYFNNPEIINIPWGTPENNAKQIAGVDKEINLNNETVNIEEKARCLTEHCTDILVEHKHYEYLFNDCKADKSKPIKAGWTYNLSAITHYVAYLIPVQHTMYLINFKELQDYCIANEKEITGTKEYFANNKTFVTSCFAIPWHKLIQTGIKVERFECKYDNTKVWKRIDIQGTL